MEKPISNGWKITAIIFIILFIIETLFLSYAFYAGLKDSQNKDNCNFECLNGGSNAYVIKDNVCNCYINGELAFTKLLN